MQHMMGVEALQSQCGSGGGGWDGIIPNQTVMDTKAPVVLKIVSVGAALWEKIIIHEDKL